MGLIYKLKRKFSSNKGIIFERKCTKELKKAFKKHKSVVFEDLLLVDKNNYKSQIDNIVVTRNNVYVIEVKKKYGNILKIDNENLTQILNQNTKHTFKNPKIQNESHIRFLKSISNTNLNFVNLIIYSDDALLDFKDNYSINLKQISEFVSKNEHKSNAKFDKTFVRLIKESNDNTFSNRRSHKKYIKKKEKIITFIIK